jgi:cytoskeletal protein RodZ
MPDQAMDIGDRLREARLAKGLTLGDIAARTKISPPSLTAMERNAFGRLPGGVFRRAYVRAFAAEVGLDPEALVRDYRARYEPEVVPEPSAPRRFVMPDHLRGWPGAVASAVVGLVVVLWLSPEGAPRPEETRAAASEAAPAADAATAGSAIAEAAEPPDVVFAEGDNSDAPLRLRLRLSNTSWISVYADGQRVVYRLAQPGEDLRIEATRAITLHAGDAGAVAYALNGDVAQPLGDTGEVLTVRFTGNGRRPAGAGRVAPPEGVSAVG